MTGNAAVARTADHHAGTLHRATLAARTWVAVFDGGKGAVFENEGFDDAPCLRLVFARRGDHAAADRGDDPRGRFLTPNGGRTACGAPDRTAQRELIFVQNFLCTLEARAREDDFDRLVLIAPARWLPLVRAHAPETQARLAAFRDRDLAGATVQRIEAAFQEAVAAP